MRLAAPEGAIFHPFANRRSIFSPPRVGFLTADAALSLCAGGTLICVHNEWREVWDEPGLHGYVVAFVFVIQRV